MLTILLVPTIPELFSIKKCTEYLIYAMCYLWVLDFQRLVKPVINVVIIIIQRVNAIVVNTNERVVKCSYGHSEGQSKDKLHREEEKLLAIPPSFISFYCVREHWISSCTLWNLETSLRQRKAIWAQSYVLSANACELGHVILSKKVQIYY